VGKYDRVIQATNENNTRRMHLYAVKDHTHTHTHTHFYEM